MDTKLLAGIAVIAIIAIAGMVLMSVSNSASGLPASAINGSQQGSLSTINRTAAQQPANSSNVLFAGTQYAAYSYQVYPGNLSQEAQAALSGFNLTSTSLQNGSARVKIALIGTSQYQYLILKPAYKLYIIETSFGDDGFSMDSSLGDDGFVVVDPNGYVSA
ncbi:MAG: hypothetical protein KGH72_06170 [Candidatus Micrarchaeota archaeon]|nr:hypothetical protein [Candidatus Micrarchaeota archaeon]